MATNEIETLTVSQCISSDYCRGWNAAVKEANKTIERLERLLDDKCDRCISRDRLDAMHELTREIINNILPKYLYGHEGQALRIGFAISEKVNELTRKE